MASESYPVLCWNCLGEFDALGAVWCSDDPKNPTKLCPFCFRCFCEASERYKQEFWRRATPRLHEELATLNRSKDRLGDILIRMRKITTPQLLEALIAQKQTSQRLGEILTERGLVRDEDIRLALAGHGSSPLTDTLGMAYASETVWEQSDPNAIIEYILMLAARKGASDVHVEPKDDTIAVKYRIDGFFFRVDPIPKRFQEALTRRLFDMFKLDLDRPTKPQGSRTRMLLAEAEYDLVVQTLPTAQGVSATVKLVNRATFLKDLTTLGLEIEDRVPLMERLSAPLGLVLISSPLFNGANTTTYSLLNFLARGQREVVSVEWPILWRVEGVRQVEVEDESHMEDTLRSVIGVRPEVLVISALPDRATATMAVQLASSVLVVAAVSSQTASQALTALMHAGLPPNLVAGSLSAVTCQRLVRQICRICSRPAAAPAPQTLAQHGIGPEEAASFIAFRGQGCPSCNKIGFRGRRAVFEVLAGAPAVRTAVTNRLSAPEIEAAAVANGMTTLQQRCLALVRAGITTFDQFVRLRL